MTKFRNFLGILAALILLLSSLAHSLLGWPNIRAQLEAAHAPADLITGLQIGWQFGGVAMVVFAAITAAVFIARMRGQQVSAFAPLVIAIAYLAFGTWALVATRNPFFAIFIAPAVLLLVASPS
ncbi:MAG TPA: hypothetical protein VJZ00_14970 [Thermoanaerobaculia bacterium]|nr:hypothetical protein [Thermoanaerobaculia bacterium]